jgi:hypothetical protein
MAHDDYRKYTNNGYVFEENQNFIYERKMSSNSEYSYGQNSPLQKRVIRNVKQVDLRKAAIQKCKFFNFFN